MVFVTVIYYQSLGEYTATATTMEASTSLSITFRFHQESHHIFVVFLNYFDAFILLELTKCSPNALIRNIFYRFWCKANVVLIYWLRLAPATAHSRDNCLFLAKIQFLIDREFSIR